MTTEGEPSSEFEQAATRFRDYVTAHSAESTSGRQAAIRDGEYSLTGDVMPVDGVRISEFHALDSDKTGYSVSVTLGGTDKYSIWFFKDSFTEHHDEDGDDIPIEPETVSAFLDRLEKREVEGGLVAKPA